MHFVTSICLSACNIGRSSPEFKVVRAIAADDITFAIQYCRNEVGWGYSVSDNKVFFATAPQRCYCGMLGDKKISYIQIATYGDNEEYSFIGAFVVLKEHRHKGYGKKTWDFAVSELPKDSLIGLSAVLQLEATYAKIGFKSFWTEFSFRFSADNIAKLPLSCRSDINIIRYKDANIENLTKYDSNIFCYSRESYLKIVGEVSESEGWVATNQEGKIIGYVVARLSMEVYGWFILPLIADDISVAEALLVEMSKSVSSQPVKTFTMNIPDINESAMAFAKHHAEEMILESRRMYANGEPSDCTVANHAKRIFSVSYTIG